MTRSVTHNTGSPDIHADTLAALGKEPHALAGLQRGVEKESLRVTPDGALSQLPHPRALGSPLTHEAITTDFSEAQVELITGVHNSPEACLEQLTNVHRAVYASLGDELLWPSSMPCILATDEDIPVGQYGTSNIAQAKTVYRLGLGLRYGRLMQTISGIHYNFSLPESAWPMLGINDQDGITAAYFGLIRNFRRWSWLLLYLFGASPAVCKSFTRGMKHNLQSFDEGSMYLPHATSLRMGPLGYQSNAQSELHISYNSLDEYANSMVEALTWEYPEYAARGVKKNGNYQQLNAAILQIENEFYGTIRPKRPIRTGERPITALRDRGVEYVEVRCLDLNPFLPIGIDTEAINFLDTFLLVCLLAESGMDSEAESQRMAANQLSIVERGRDPELRLSCDEGKPLSVAEWGQSLLDACATVADILDKNAAGTPYRAALAAQQAKVDDSARTPSARILAEMQEQEIPFFRFSMNRAIAHQAHFAGMPLDDDEQAAFDRSVEASLARQQEIEQSDDVGFDEFLEDYLAIPQMDPAAE